jgi:hypothetical protein
MEGDRVRVDTRAKIVTPEALLALDPPRPLLVAAGRFDVLRVEAARELDAARERTGAKTLVVAIAPLADALAPLGARAEMAAALRVIDYVFIASNEDPDRKEWDRLIASLQPTELIDLTGADTERVRQLIEHVRGRQSA